MRRLLLASSALAAAATLSFQVSAADYRSPKAVAPPPAPLIFTGPYAGIHVGYAMVDESVDFLDGFVPPFPLLKTGDTGLAGFYAGYNWMAANNWLWGVEGDLSYAAARHDAWGGSVRLRVGPVVNQTLYYLTGGVVFAKARPEINAAIFGSSSFATSKTETTWTIGAGIEHWFTDRISMKAEYRYDDFGQVSTVFPCEGCDAIANVSAAVQTIRVGIALHW